MMGIYEIINLDDGKMTSYVGSSADVKRRWAEHVAELRTERHGNPRLQRAWDKYGEGAFLFCVLEEVVDEASLLESEQHWLDRAFEMGGTYNTATTAGSSGPASEETKRKLSEIMKARWASGEVYQAEWRLKISRALTGRRLSGEHRRRVSEAQKGKTLPEKHKRKISEALKGHVFSREHRRNLSEAKAKPYPAFIHHKSGAIIPAGRNLKAMCERHGLKRRSVSAVKNGKRKSHKGWTLLEKETR